MNQHNARILIGLFVAFMSPQIASAVVINYDGSNRPTSVTGLNVPSFGVFDISFTNWSPAPSFNGAFGTGNPPNPLPGLTFGNLALAQAVSSQLATEMNLDATPIPPISPTNISFPLSTTASQYDALDLFTFMNSAWTADPNPITLSRTSGGGSHSFATVIPEPSAFLFLGVVGLSVGVHHMVKKRRRRMAIKSEASMALLRTE